MPVTLAIKNETSGTSGAPKNMSGTKTLTVVVTITAVDSVIESVESVTETTSSASVTGSVASAMIAEALGTTITKVYITASLMDGTGASDFIAGAGTPAGAGAKEYPVTLNIAAGDARFNQVCKLVPHAVATGGDNGDFTGSPLNFIKIV